MLKNQLKAGMLVLSILAFSGLTGCAKDIKIYPITDKDFKVTDDGKWICMSPTYVEEVLKAKVEQ